MNLCDNNHREVCYEGRECPACEERKAKEAAEKECGSLQDQVDELQRQIDEGDGK